MEWEVGIIEWLENNMGSISRFLGKLFAFLGDEKGLLILVLVVMFCWRKEAGRKLAVIVTLVNAWLPMLKTAVLRPRPYMSHPDRIRPLELIDKSVDAMDVAAQGYSFPSMHSASIAASYFTLAQKVRKKWFWILAVVLTLLVGFFRVAVGMHYPTDVLAGWGLGLVIMSLYGLLERLVRKEWIRLLVLLLLTLPGLLFVRTQDYFTALGMLAGLCLAFPYEQKYVKFQDTRNIWALILRPLGAAALYFALNSLLKLPFGKEFLESTELAAFLVRSARYAIIIFVIFGLYPRVFPLYEKIGKPEK